MNLSLYTGGVKPYLEYGWVCAPNTAGQSIAANTITTLYLSNEIADTGNFGSLSAGTFPTGTASATSQITLAAGTYYFKSWIPITSSSESARINAITSVYNVTSTSYVSRKEVSTSYVDNLKIAENDGQFTLAVQSSLELRLIAAIHVGVIIVGNTTQYANFTGTTVGDDQRTTIKLWKLA
jgi:hypothetical protein